MKLPFVGLIRILVCFVLISAFCTAKTFYLPSTEHIKILILDIFGFNIYSYIIFRQLHRTFWRSIVGKLSIFYILALRDSASTNSYKHQSLISRFSSWGSTYEEKTLAIIKPDGLLGNYTDDIKKRILKYGFSILAEKTVQLDQDTVARFYAEHSSKSFFSSLIKYMTSGPVLAMILEKENAIADWRALMGPTDAGKAKNTHPHSIRAMCGLDTERNCVHGSDSLKSAQREISYFFREMSADLVIEHDEL